MGKTITICFTNNKGGSGKTTTCSNLGAAMAQARESGLLDDLELGYEQGFEGYAEEPFDSFSEEAGADENHAEEDGTAAFGDVDFAGNEAEEGLGEENYQEQ